MNGLSHPVPTRRDEPWRYTPQPVLDALAALPVDERIDVPAGGGETIVLQPGPGISAIALTIGAGARAELFLLLAGPGYRRFDLDVVLETGAHLELGCVAVARAGETAEVVTRIRHESAGATSHQVVRAVAAGDGLVNVLGRIDVARDAQQTDAALGIKGLLHGRQATINARPELEIYADDVKCAHGCAIGQLDEAALFYAQARGLPLDAARALLMQAFAAEAFLAMADGAQRTALEQAAAQAIARTGGVAL